MSITVHNLLHSSEKPASAEETKTLFTADDARIEQIVSHGHPSPEGFWYNQPDAEWVALIKGSATLLVEGQGSLDLDTGDYLLIPAHVRHRVEQVSEDAVWLAVHLT